MHNIPPKMEKGKKIKASKPSSSYSGSISCRTFFYYSRSTFFFSVREFVRCGRDGRGRGGLDRVEGRHTWLPGSLHGLSHIYRVRCVEEERGGGSVMLGIAGFGFGGGGGGGGAVGAEGENNATCYPLVAATAIATMSVPNSV